MSARQVAQVLVVAVLFIGSYISFGGIAIRQYIQNTPAARAYESDRGCQQPLEVHAHSSCRTVRFTVVSAAVLASRRSSVGVIRVTLRDAHNIVRSTRFTDSSARLAVLHALRKRLTPGASVYGQVFNSAIVGLVFRNAYIPSQDNPSAIRHRLEPGILILPLFFVAGIVLAVCFVRFRRLKQPRIPQLRVLS